MCENNFTILYTQAKIYILFDFLYNLIIYNWKIWYDSNLFIQNCSLNIVFLTLIKLYIFM